MLNFNLNNFTKTIPKFYLSLPKKNSIIIFDDIERNIISSFIKNKDIYFIKTRGNTYNFFALIYALFFFYRSNFKIEYLNFFFMISQSSILLTTSFKTLIIYQIKHFYPHRKILVIQNGSFGQKFLNMIKKSSYKNLICDYFFCLSKYEINVLRKLINTNFKIIGSFRSNHYPLSREKKNNSIVYISQYRKALLKKANFRDLYYTEKKILPLLLEFCKKNNKLLEILPGENNYQLEYMHYKKILRSNQFFLYKKNIKNSYKVCDISRMCVGIDSTLIFESMSRGTKIAIFNFDISHNRNITSITKNYFQYSKGKFWLDYFNVDKINQIFKYVYNVNKNKWKNDNFTQIFKLPYYRNNEMINNTLNKLLEINEK